MVVVVESMVKCEVVVVVVSGWWTGVGVGVDGWMGWVGWGCVLVHWVHLLVQTGFYHTVGSGIHQDHSTRLFKDNKEEW